MVTVSEFKAKCLGIIAEVERDKKPVSITKNGRVAVRVVPAAEHGRETFYGRAKKSTVICGELLSTEERWDAED